MKQQDEELRLMDYLEGEHPVKFDKSLINEAEKLAQIQEQVQALPLASVNPETDREFYAFLGEIRDPKKESNITLRRLWPFVLAAASLAFLIYIFYPKSLASHYAELTSNSDKINFIYALNNKQQLSVIEIDWLKYVLRKESNPNVKVVLLDLIENRSYLQLTENLSEELLNEDIPSVQMAVLNTLEYGTNSVVKNNLRQFQERDDLESMVRNRTQELINLK